jgi:acetyl-CoA C-acetyltransferase
MTTLAPNTPVIIGVGFYQNHAENPLDCPEPFELMVNAVRDAARDAVQNAQLSTGSEKILAELDSISVEQGMWQYRNPGKLILDAIGNTKAKSILADLGVLQLNPLFDVFEAITSGKQQMGVVTGGEAKFRELRAKITGVAVSNTVQGDDTPAPDVYHPTPDPFATEAESTAGIFMPVELFAIIESALRYHKGLGVEEHRDTVAQLYSGFSEIAAKNPHAWSREVVSANDIRNAVGKNAMLAFPYTKKHNSQWNVNQAVAIIVCSARKAQELGLDSSRWIYPVAAVQSRHVVCLAEQKQLHSHPGTRMAGQRAYQLAGITPQQVNAADLYSCFPSAVQSFALDLQLEDVCPLSVTGSMAFAGGPYNHGALDGVARMVEVLRSGEGIALGESIGKSMATSEKRFGLTSNLSGIFGKQAVALFSNRPNDNGYCFDDITDAVKAVDIPLPSTTDYQGAGTIVGYTVCYNKDEVSHGFIYCDTADGRRTVAKSMDKGLLEQMTREEFVGKPVNIHADRTFTCT